jgi:predicted Zn-dependent protease
MRPALAAKQAMIDRYEAFLAAENHEGMLEFLKTIEPESIRLNPNVVARDAITLDSAGKKAEAKALLQAVARIRPKEFALWNVLGYFCLRDGDRKGAGDAFRRSLDIMPRNAVAEKGLADSLAATPAAR